MRRIGKITSALVAAVCVAAIGAGSASASTLSLSNGVLTYTGAPAEANHVTFSFDYFHSVFVIQDTGTTALTVVNATRNGPCASSSAQSAYCSFGSVASIVAHLGDGGSYARSMLVMTPMTAYAGAGNDTLIGGGANDTLIGGPGHDSYDGGGGNDAIRARNSVSEDVSCGAGTDVVTADPADTTTADCETVDRGTQPDASDPVAPQPGVTPAVPLPAIAPTPVSVSRNRVPVEVGCPEAAPGGCTGAISLTLAGPTQTNGKVSAARRVKRVISRPKRFRIAAGSKAVVRVVLNRRGVRKFKRAGRRSLKVLASVSINSEAGAKTTTRTIIVRADRRSRGNQKARRKK